MYFWSVRCLCVLIEKCVSFQSSGVWLHSSFFFSIENNRNFSWFPNNRIAENLFHFRTSTQWQSAQNMLFYWGNMLVLLSCQIPHEISTTIICQTIQKAGASCHHGVPETLHTSRQDNTAESTRVLKQVLNCGDAEASRMGDGNKCSVLGRDILAWYIVLSRPLY